MDIEQFKKELAPRFGGAELKYRYFESGDFGALWQIEFNVHRIGGNVDIWEKGWIGIFAWDFEKEEDLMNILLAPNQIAEQAEFFDQLIKLI